VTGLRVLCWPGMPAAAALAEAGRRIGCDVVAEAVSSNERLEARLGEERFDVAFPSDYLVERLAARGDLLALEAPEAIVGQLEGWARDAAHDPGCRWSLPFAFGTTGFLCTAPLDGAGAWADLFAAPPGVRVGMLGEAREVVGAALIAAGRSPNETSGEALEAARRRLLDQRPSVARYDSDDFVGPLLRSEVAAHQAWSGPAAAAVRADLRLRYVLPSEGANLWVTTGVVPAGAPRPDAGRQLLLALCDPELAALTTRREGYATPNAAARARLPEELRRDETLFPPEAVLRGCTTFRDLGADEARVVRLYEEIATPS
jgi:spermidine/putrescine transport system substrate-binding protein